MSSKIRVLDEHTINQIAAGEVIENPSSVVKEMVENALDAGATEIQVEILTGGRQLIRISDNGCGMNQDDALLCFERHATSKMRSVEDMQLIGTLGFRGEAVPSIASISKVTLITASKENPDKGTMIIVEGGKILKCCEAVRHPGTTFEIKSIFYNVPVRRNFQKSPNYDTNEIQKMLTRLALAHPQVRFELISNQEMILKSTPDKERLLEKRVEDLLGKEYLKATTPIEYSYGAFTLKGFISKPTETRSNRMGQYLILNGRTVVSPLVSNTIKEAYGTMIPEGRFPLFVLYLDMPPGLVDVNVHPQKREVRLRKEHDIHDIILKGVGRALYKKEAPTPTPARAYIPPTPPADFSFKPASAPVRRSIPTPAPEPTLFVPPKPIEATIRSPILIATLRGYLVLDPLSCRDMGLKENPEVGSLVLLDQKTAHERILYERFLKMEEKPCDSQQLLLPHSISLLKEEVDHLIDNQEALSLMGFEVKKVNDENIEVSSVPVDLEYANITAIMRDIASHINMHSTEALALAACKHAVQRSTIMENNEARAFLERLFQCRMPFASPTGKPIIVSFSTQELAQKFSR